MDTQAENGHAVMLDEEPSTSGTHLWRAVGAAGAELQHRTYAGTAAEAVHAVRKTVPDRHVVICPRTPRGRQLAKEAARVSVHTTVSGYQVWVTEERAFRHVWNIHWYGKPEGRSRVTGCATAAAAVARIRKRMHNAAIRIVAKTPAGKAEAAALADGRHIVIRDRLTE